MLIAAEDNYDGKSRGFMMAKVEVEVETKVETIIRAKVEVLVDLQILLIYKCQQSSSLDTLAWFLENYNSVISRRAQVFNSCPT